MAHTFDESIRVISADVKAEPQNEKGQFEPTIVRKHNIERATILKPTETDTEMALKDHVQKQMEKPI